MCTCSRSVIVYIVSYWRVERIVDRPSIFHRTTSCQAYQPNDANIGTTRKTYPNNTHILEIEPVETPAKYIAPAVQKIRGQDSPPGGNARKGYFSGFHVLSHYSFHQIEPRPGSEPSRLESLAK